MKHFVIVLAAMLVLMVSLLTTSPPTWLRVQTADGEPIVCLAVDRDDVVALQFTHSMYGGYVREEWRIAPGNQLVRERFVTENAAAAEYYATDGSSYQAADGYVVPGNPLQQSELVVRVNNRGNHILSTHGESVSLIDLTGDSTQVRIFVAGENCEELP